jgi:hypothetical protein
MCHSLIPCPMYAIYPPFAASHASCNSFSFAFTADSVGNSVTGLSTIFPSTPIFL